MMKRFGVGAFSLEWCFQNKLLALSFLFLSTTTLGLLGLGIWSFVGTLEESVSGMGQMAPDEHVRRIMTDTGGRLAKIYVHEGEVVKKGQLLFELDPESELIDNSAIKTQLSQLQAQANALRQALKTGGEIPAVLSAQDNGYNELQGQWVGAIQQSLDSELASSDLDIERLTHEVEVAKAQQAQTESLLQTSEAMLKDYQKLYEQGGLPKNDLLTYEQKVIAQRGDLQAIKEEVSAKKLALESSKFKPVTLKSNYQQSMFRQLSEIEQKISTLQASLQKSDVIQKHQQIVAPVSGTIHEMAVHGENEVTKPGDILTSMVPDTGSLVAEVKVLNHDLSYVYPGQRAELRLDAFPYQQYGRLYGQVSDISPSTISDQQGHVYYLVKIKPEKMSLLRNGESQPFRSGMTVTANLITREKPIFTFFTEPLAQKVDQAFRDPSNR